MRLQKLLTFFFNKKYLHTWDISVWNFNESLTNDVVSFEQPGPGVLLESWGGGGRLGGEILQQN